jgi:endonuclease G, mitochondrial
MISRTASILIFSVLVSNYSSADILSVHCPLGCPENPGGNDLVFGHLYALSNNPNTKFADWVAYEVSVTNFGNSPGRVWASDPLLSEEKSLEEADYDGAFAQLRTDRGHQAPLASFAGSPYWSELNYLSNITPQKSALNQGPWQYLEQAVRDGSQFRNSLFVITGTIYDNPNLSLELPESDEPHQIPDAYYKIVYNEKGEAAAFVMEQDTERNVAFCSTSQTMQQLLDRVTYDLPSLVIADSIRGRLGC